jgi:hypothetical protein
MAPGHSPAFFLDATASMVGAAFGASGHARAASWNDGSTRVSSDAGTWSTGLRDEWM